MKKITTLLLLTCSMLIFGLKAEAKSFSDIPKDYPYHKEIIYLTDLGIINGHVDGTFKPKQYITNRQAAVMMVRALNAHDIKYKEANLYYIDVTKNDPAFKEISIVYTLNIFRDKYYQLFDLTSNNPKPVIEGWRFFPDEYLTRENMAHTLVNGFLLTGREDIKFSDVNSNTTLSVEDIPILADNNITSGYEDGTFKPKHYVSREHFAVFMYRTLEVLNSQKESLLSKLKVGETISPVPEYIMASSYGVGGTKGTVHSVYYDGGRYALVIHQNDIRLLDMNSMKLTTSIGEGSTGNIHGNTAAWIDLDGLVLLDLTTKLSQSVILPNTIIQSIHFSDDGNYIFLKTMSEVELSPQYIYNIKTKEFTEIPYYELSDMQNSWLNGEFYFWGMSNFERVAIDGGYSYSKMLQGLYAYNPITKKTRTIHEENSFSSPRNLSFSGNNASYSDSGVHLMNLNSGKVSALYSTPTTTSSFRSDAIVSTISEDAVYYVDGQSVIQYDLSSKERKTLLTLANVSKDSNDNNIALKLVDNYLFIYGSSVPMTILRIK